VFQRPRQHRLSRWVERVLQLVAPAAQPAEGSQASAELGADRFFNGIMAAGGGWAQALLGEQGDASLPGGVVSEDDAAIKTWVAVRYVRIDLGGLLSVASGVVAASWSAIISRGHVPGMTRSLCAVQRSSPSHSRSWVLPGAGPTKLTLLFAQSRNNCRNSSGTGKSASSPSEPMPHRRAI
jgi:hypothetical protein